MGKLYRLYDDMTDVGIDFDSFDFNQLPPRLDDIHPIGEEDEAERNNDGWTVKLE